MSEEIYTFAVGMKQDNQHHGDAHVVGVFDNAREMQDAWRILIKNGIAGADIGFIAAPAALSSEALQGEFAANVAPEFNGIIDGEAAICRLKYDVSLVRLNNFCICGEIMVTQGYPAGVFENTALSMREYSLAEALGSHLPDRDANEMEQAIHDGKIMLWARAGEQQKFQEFCRVFLACSGHNVRTFTEPLLSEPNQH